MWKCFVLPRPSAAMEYSSQEQQRIHWTHEEVISCLILGKDLKKINTTAAEGPTVNESDIYLK